MLSILQICNRFPYPPKDGGAIAMYNTTRAFYQLGCKTDLLVINTKKHFLNPVALPDSFKKMLNHIEWINADTAVKPIDAFINLFTSDSYNLKRFNIKEFERKLVHLLKNNRYDVIHIEGLYVSMYIDVIRKYSDALVSLRAHNVEYLIWNRLSEAAKSPLKKWYLKLLSQRLKNYEINAINKFDVLVPITEVDSDIFKKHGCKTKIFVCPAGINEGLTNVTLIKSPEISLFHLGSLDWMPNLEAIGWFLEEIWPSIHQKFPEVKFYIAGRNMPEKIKKLKVKNVIVVGEVENAADFMNSKSIMIVPLKSGSGMRIKIIEGMALGKTIVSTSIGAEGIAYSSEKNILIADTASEFANKISYAIENPYVCNDIGNQAQKLVKEQYTNKVLVSKLVDYYKELKFDGSVTLSFRGTRNLYSTD